MSFFLHRQKSLHQWICSDQTGKWKLWVFWNALYLVLETERKKQLPHLACSIPARWTEMNREVLAELWKRAAPCPFSCCVFLVCQKLWSPPSWGDGPGGGLSPLPSPRAELFCSEFPLILQVVTMWMQQAKRAPVQPRSGLPLTDSDIQGHAATTFVSRSPGHGEAL